MKKILYIIVILVSSSSIVFGQKNDALKIFVGYSHAITNNFTGDSYNDISYANFKDTVGQSKHDQLNGFEISGTYRLSDHLAAKASFSWNSGSATTVLPGGNFVRGSVQNPTYILVVPGSYEHTKQSYYTMMAGFEYRNFQSKRKLNPFGQLMIGAGFEDASNNLAGSTHAIIYGTQNLKINNTALSIDAGAGLDLTLNKNFDLRIIQVDFVPTFSGKKQIQKIGDLRGPFPGTSFPTEQLYSDQSTITNTGFQANFRFGIGIVFTPNL